MSALGSDGSPPVSTDTAREAARNMAGTVVLGAAVGGRPQPRGGGSCRGKARPHTAAEIRPKNVRERRRGRSQWGRGVPRGAG